MRSKMTSTAQVIDVTVMTNDGDITVSEWSEGGAWIYIALRGATASIVLNKFESQQFLEALQAVVAISTKG